MDSNDTTTDANSSQNLVDDANSTALFVPSEGLSAVFWECTICGPVAILTTGIRFIETIEFDHSIPVFEVSNELQNYGSSSSRITYCKIALYEDSTNVKV